MKQDDQEKLESQKCESAIGTTISGMVVGANNGDLPDEEKPFPFPVDEDNPDLFEKSEEPAVGNTTKPESELLPSPLPVLSIGQDDGSKEIAEQETLEEEGETTDRPPNPSFAEESLRLIDPPEHVGHVFSNARKQARLTLQDISEYTKISQYHLTNMEAGKFDRLPNRVHAIGYVRSLASYFDLDAERLIADYKQQSGEAEVKEQPEHNFYSTAPIHQSRVSGWFILIGVFVLLAICYYSWAHYVKPNLEEDTATNTQTIENVEIVAASPPLTNTDKAAEIETPSINEATNPEITEPAIIEPAITEIELTQPQEPEIKIPDAPIKDPITTEPTPISEPAITPTKFESNLTLVAVRPVWVKLEDQQNSVLFDGTLFPDQPLQIKNDYLLSYSDGASLWIERDGVQSAQPETILGTAAAARLISEFLPAISE